jgi:hypothetical protein
MKFKKWLESREFHLGMNPEEIEPIKKHDKLRVYHGFYSIADAINVALHGTSGKIKAKRVYSYESDNNPRGIFVTLDLKTAKENFSSSSAVMQFSALESELEPPVWPSGSYTVQGQMAQYFYQHPQGAKIGRAEKLKQEKEKASKDQYKAISQSHRPELANTLFGREMQALYMGHLEPNRIEGFHVQRKQKDYRTTDDPWEFISVQDFINEFGQNFDYKSASDYNSRYRMFTPDQEFSWQQMANHINNKYQKYNLKTEEDVYKKIIKIFMPKDFKEGLKRNNFERIFSQYFWPKQLPYLHRWIVKMHKKYGELNEV